MCVCVCVRACLRARLFLFFLQFSLCFSPYSFTILFYPMLPTSSSAQQKKKARWYRPLPVLNCAYSGWEASGPEPPTIQLQVPCSGCKRSAPIASSIHTVVRRGMNRAKYSATRLRPDLCTWKPWKVYGVLYEVHESSLYCVFFYGS